MSKRIAVSVRWEERAKGWATYKEGKSGRRKIIDDVYPSKKEAIGWARWICRGFELAELYIYNQNGKLGKGSGSRATYGRDPRKTTG